MRAEELYKFRAQAMNVSGSAVPLYLMGESEPMRELRQTVALAAGCELGVLIVGERGSGTIQIARLIHTLRGRGEFIPVFSGIECDELELKLFGYRNGVFKGPIPSSGAFSNGKGGTIIFEDIDKMPAMMQAKLAFALETGTFRKVGGTQEFRIDVHVIATTEKELLYEMANGRFRGDLYFLVAKMTLSIPPLRERGRRDMELLVQHILPEVCSKQGLIKHVRITSGVMDSLCRYDWPGNVYELEQVLSMATFNAELRDTGVITKSLIEDEIGRKLRSRSISGRSSRRR